MSRFVQLLDGSGAEAGRVGGKAAALDRLMSWGLPVPPCAAVTVAAYRSAVRQPALGELVARLAGTPPGRTDGGDDQRVEDAFRCAGLPPRSRGRAAPPR